MKILVHWTAILVLIVNINSLNYIIAYLTRQSGQDISALMLLMSIVVLIYAFLHGKARELISIYRFSISVAFLIVIVPLFSYLVNYNGQSLNPLIFWVKRELLVLTTFFVGLILLHRLSDRHWVRLSASIFYISAGAVLFSYFFPDQSRLLFTADDELWDYFGEADMRAVGTSMNPNGAAFAIVISYAVLYAVGSVRDRAFRLSATIICDALYFATLLLTGSRSGMLVGIAIFAIFKHDVLFAKGRGFIDVTKRIKMTLASVGIVAIVVAWLLLTVSGLEVSRIDRLFDFGRTDNIESNMLRYEALLDSLSLFAEYPMGVGFELRNNMLYLQAHNMFVAYLVENGIILGLVYPAFLYLVWIQVHDHNFRVARIAFITVLVGFSFFDHGIIESKPFSWLIIGIAFVLQRQWVISRMAKDTALSGSAQQIHPIGTLDRSATHKRIEHATN